MNAVKLGIAAALAVALVASAPATDEALAQGAKAAKTAKTCVSKAGQGTGSTDDNARFQAWEAVLQATDWGSWASWMSSKNRIGDAPGYSVKNLKQRCIAGGGLGRECTIQATLCK